MKKQKFNDEKWLREKAAIEDKSLVSVGGLVTDLKKAEARLWDVVVYEIDTRKVEAVVGKDLREDGFHAIGKRLDTMATRVGDDYNVAGVPAGKFKKGDVLPKNVEEYEE